MKILVAAIVTFFISTSAYPDVMDCQNLYVGRIRVENGSGGLDRAVFINAPSSSTGSYWVSFSSWDPDDKNAALSLLMAAKISQHRVNIKTLEANGCDIREGQTTALRIELANMP